MDVRGMSDSELAVAIERVLAKAARCSPPISIMQSQEQAALLLKLAQLRDEQARRNRLRGSPRPPSMKVTG